MKNSRAVLALFLAALACAAVLPLFAPHPCPLPDGARGTENRCAMPRSKAASPEWAEARWLPADATPLRHPLTALEESFASRFPGHIARFSDGRHVWIVRVMDRPTRMLHPAADCFRGLGYSVQPPRVHTDAHERNWRCFAAEKNSRRLKVCERIFDRKDGNWTDTSSWYWSALLGRESGPWWAVTQVEEGR
jgi:hypothetical protein